MLVYKMYVLQLDFTGFLWIYFEIYLTSFYLYFVILLMPINWGLETLKWSFISGLTFSEALKGVLKGLSLSMLMPAEVADSVGRSSDDKTLFVKTIWSGMMQNCITFGFAVLAIFHFQTQNDSFDWWLNLLTYSAFILSIIGILCFHFPKLIFIQKWRQIIVSNNFDNLQITKVVAVGLLRYFVFLFQYYLLIRLFYLGESNLDLFSAVAVTFSVKTMIPALNFLSEIGVREFSALYVFQNLKLQVQPVIAASAVLWFINIFPLVIVGLKHWLKWKK